LILPMRGLRLIAGSCDLTMARSRALAVRTVPPPVSRGSHAVVSFAPVVEGSHHNKSNQTRRRKRTHLSRVAASSAVTSSRTLLPTPASINPISPFAFALRGTICG
jgi:hypothetical protein